MRTVLQPGQNPRDVLSNHRERGFKQFSYTYEDLAALFGMTVGAVRSAVHRGCFDPECLLSVVAYAAKRGVSVDLEDREQEVST